ncbi:50S ribosomal protein L3 [Patescibacteria group bacterium]|nr:50S ribosomal protein L3 [Patescibacteria group bacterium]
MSGIIGKKVGMTRLIKDDGRVIPITVVECEPNEITQIKTTEKDGYPALVLGFVKLKKPTKTKKFKLQREFRIKDDETDSYKKGDSLSVESLKEFETVTVTSTSKGKGFQGVIKRHNFSRGPETHGSHHHRRPGSIGACTKPGRVAKGKKLPGQMGSKQVTRRGVSIELLDEKKNIICLKGAVPGAKDSIVIIKTN